MEKSENFPEATDILYFVPFKKNDSVLLISDEPLRYDSYIRRYARDVETLRKNKINHLEKTCKTQKYDKVLVLLPKCNISNASIRELNSVLKPEGELIFAFRGRLGLIALKRSFKKGLLRKPLLYGLFDSLERPSYIIPLKNAPLSYYFKNIKAPTMKHHKRVFLNMLLSLKIHFLAVPAFLAICEKA